jgi:3-methyladenine DNA glycosylase/8-oxoguanine DNA glycosylase
VSLDYDPEEAIAYLRRSDRRLGRVVERVGPYRLEARPGLTPFEGLLRSIVYQQLSGKAAGAIHERLRDLFPRRRPGPRLLLALDDEQLRAAGLSRGKVAAARDLARKTLARDVPSRETLRGMDDEAIIERLVAVRGIGRWTVEMILIFQLGRPDVLPVTDLGVRKGFRLSHGGDDLPEPNELLRHGERWRPFRSVASWYLWRATELDWPG